MIKWQNGFFGDSKAAAFDWAEALSNAANAAVAKSQLSQGMRSFWKFAAFRPTESISILYG